MKKKIYFFIGIVLIPLINSFSQYVPNGGFENWEERILYEEPVWWNTGNLEAFVYSEATACDTSDSYHGDLALRLESKIIEGEILFGYAFCQGTVTGGSASDTLYFEGGIPVSGAPDAFRGYFKYHIPANDTGIILASFKKDGLIIGQNIFPITGNQSTYTRMEWEIDDMAEVPDTAMIAFACSNPDSPQAGGWMQIDSIGFIGIDDTIPNADFEYWETASCQEPENWVTANLFTTLFGGDTCATPTNDSHTGEYAIRIEAVQTMIPSDEGMTSAVVGFAMPYSTSFNFNESMPSFDVDFNPSLLTGYYKFEPVLNDTAMVYVMLTDTAGNTYPSGMILLPTDTYHYFFVPLIAPFDVEISQVTIVASTTIYFMQGDGQSGEIGSVLYLDDLDLVNPCDGNTFSISNISYPLCDDYTAVLDAGSGWDEYLWSTGDTTQSINVTIEEPVTISVTVTDNSTGCQYEDEASISMPTGCDAVEELTRLSSGISMFPNPTNGILTVEFSNTLQGEYLMQIIAITGKVIHSEQINLNQKTKSCKFDLTKFPEGLYMVKISGNNFNYCERLMIN